MLEEWAVSLAYESLAMALPKRWAHVQGVAARTEITRSIFPEDEYMILYATAMLHDIGYAPKLRKTGFHALDGAQYLHDQGVPERVCALVAHHSCAYREAELRGLSAELAVWQDEETPLRDTLWWADMSTTPDGTQTNVYDRIEEIQKRYGPANLVSFFIRQAKSELVAAVERTEERLQMAGIDYTAK